MVFEAGQKFTTDLESSTPLLATSLLAMPPKLTYSSKPSTLALTGMAQHEPNPELPLLKTFSLATADTPFVFVGATCTGEYFISMC